MLGRLAQMCLYFAEGLLDRVEVGRVRGKIKERCARRFDRLLDTIDFVGREIVHDDDGATIARSRRPATKVSVFQFPRGT